MGHEPNPLDLPLSETVEHYRVFQEHSPRLRAMLGRRIDPRFAARIHVDDLLHEAYMTAQRRWPGFRDSGMSPLAWLYRIGLDTLIEAIRRETRECRDPRREVAWPERSSVQLGLGLLGSLTTASKALEREEIQERVRLAIEELKPDDREVLWMKHFDGLAPSEIAEVLGLQVGAVYQRLGRALLRLKRLLADLDPDPDAGAPGHE